MADEAVMLTESQDGATVILTLDQPARRNALAMPMRQAVAAAMNRIEADPSVRAVVVTGKGGNFSAGGDISGMNVTEMAAGRERFRATHEMVRLMVKSSKPIIAAVEGFAVGAGLSVALCCDTIVAGEGAQFAAGFGRVGLIADLGLPFTLPRRVGHGRARQILLYGERIGVEEALRIGLIDHAAAAGGALEMALGRARMFHDMAPMPVAMTKQWLAQGLDAALEWERDTQAALFGTPDHAEGKAAFLEKRAPRFGPKG